MPVTMSSCEYTVKPFSASGRQIELSSGHDITKRFVWPFRMRTVGDWVNSYGKVISDEGDLRVISTYLATAGCDNGLQQLGACGHLGRNVERQAFE